MFEELTKEHQEMLKDDPEIEKLRRELLDLVKEKGGICTIITCTHDLASTDHNFDRSRQADELCCALVQLMYRHNQADKSNSSSEGSKLQ